MKRVRTIAVYGQRACVEVWKKDCFVTIREGNWGVGMIMARWTECDKQCRARHTVPEGPGDVAGALGGRTCTCTLENACGLKIESARAKGMRANSCRLYWVVTSFVDGSFVDGRRARKCQRVSAVVRVGE